jgi:hypothetical protein
LPQDAVPTSKAPALLRTCAKALAANRIAFGIAYLVAPKRSASGWVGSAGESGASTVITRALGARDLMLGAGALLALREEDAAQCRRWFGTQAMSDGVDLVATVLARRELPNNGFRLGAAMAAGSTLIAGAAAAWLAK